MIRFTCPSCKTLLQTGDDQGGVLVGCPKCRSQMKVPLPSVPPPAAIVPMVGNTAGATQTGRPATLPSSPQPVEARLRELLTKHGAGLCSEARRCESMIRDICGDKTKEAHLLIQGLKQQLPTDLLAIPKGASPVPALERLRKRLEDNLGLAEAPARWTVQCWALALHVVTEADLKADELPPTAAPAPAAQEAPPINPVLAERGQPVWKRVLQDVVRASVFGLMSTVGCSMLGALLFAVGALILGKTLLFCTLLGGAVAGTLGVCAWVINEWEKGTGPLRERLLMTIVAGAWGFTFVAVLVWFLPSGLSGFENLQIFFWICGVLFVIVVVESLRFG